MSEGQESVRVQVPVNVDVQLSEDLFEKALLKSKTFWEDIKPRLDLAKFIEQHIKDKKGFYMWFYTAQDKDMDSLMEKLTEEN